MWEVSDIPRLQRDYVAGTRPETSRKEPSRADQDMFLSDQSNVVEIMTREAINEAALHSQLDYDDDSDGDEDENQFTEKDASPESEQLDMQKLFSYTTDYQPEAIELFAELKCFIPDYIPAIGDIDPMIKVTKI